MSVRMRHVVCGMALLAGGFAASGQNGRSRAAEMPPEPTGALGQNAGGGVEVSSGAAGTAGKLRVLFADVEGGQATLFVTPKGRSLLVDTGWPGNGGRDAQRIVLLAHRAGLKRIDAVLLTHYHVDHAGGVPELVARIPVGRFLDHGGNTEPGVPETAAAFLGYEKVLRRRRIPRTTVRVGQALPVPGLRAEGVEAMVVSSDGGVLETPLPDAGKPNPACGRSPERPLEGSENDRSVGFVLRFGRFRALDLGDLTWGMERSLVCPVDKLGAMDLMVVSHHGTARSNSPALIFAVRPRVAVIDNGPHKGAEAATMKTLEDSNNDVGAVWQLHAAEGLAPELNTVQDRMANRAGEDGSWLEVDASRDGTLEVTNGRTGQVIRYSGAAPRHRS